MPDFDLVVIGAGAAGLSVTAVAAQLGLKVALIERDRMGGDCLNFGCVPSKALLAASHAAQAARAAGRFGVRLPEPEIDWDAVRAHVDGVIAAIAPTNSAERFRHSAPRCCAARPASSHPTRCRWMAGGSPRAASSSLPAAPRPVPPIPGLDRVAYLDQRPLFDLG